MRSATPLGLEPATIQPAKHGKTSTDGQAVVPLVVASVLELDPAAAELLAILFELSSDHRIALLRAARKKHETKLVGKVKRD